MDGSNSRNEAEWKVARRGTREKTRDERDEGGRKEGCHKFKQQLTFSVKACGNGPLATRICIAVLSGNRGKRQHPARGVRFGLGAENIHAARA